MDMGIEEDDVPKPKPTIANETPEFVRENILKVVTMFERYGWFILFGVMALMFLWYKIRPHYKQWRKRRQEEEELKKFDINEAAKQEASMQEARLRMQARYNSLAEVHAEENKKKEEERRKERIEDWDNHRMGKGYKSKLKSHTPKEDPSQTDTVKPKKPLKPLRDNDYNPLCGGGGGSSYRPGRRGGAGGGG